MPKSEAAELADDLDRYVTLDGVPGDLVGVARALVRGYTELVLRRRDVVVDDDLDLDTVGSEVLLVPAAALARRGLVH